MEPRLLVAKLEEDKKAAMVLCDQSRQEVGALEEKLQAARASAGQRFNDLVDIETRLANARTLAAGEPVVTPVCQRDHSKLRTNHCPACGAAKEWKDGSRSEG
jgi:hypothetical protein